MWQVGAIILYTYVFQMLAPPPGGYFDCIEEDKLPIKSQPTNPLPEQVPLLNSREPELTEFDSPKRGKVRRYFSDLLFFLTGLGKLLVTCLVWLPNSYPKFSFYWNLKIFP